MMRRSWVALLLGLLLTGGVFAARAESQWKKLTPLPLVEVSAVVHNGVVVADRFAITARWQMVVQANGQPVAKYLWRFVRNDSVSAMTPNMYGETTGLSVTRNFGFPAPGDSAKYYAEVRAVDTRGMQSPFGRSIAIWVKGETWTPPPPPNVTIDTARIAMGLDTDSMHTFWLAFNEATGAYSRMEEPVLIKANDSTVLCVEGWKGDFHIPLAEQDALCGGPLPHTSIHDSQPSWLYEWSEENRRKWGIADENGCATYPPDERRMCSERTGFDPESPQCKYGRAPGDTTTCTVGSVQPGGVFVGLHAGVLVQHGFPVCVFDHVTPPWRTLE